VVVQVTQKNARPGLAVIDLVLAKTTNLFLMYYLTMSDGGWNICLVSGFVLPAPRFNHATVPGYGLSGGLINRKIPVQATLSRI
jgi:hypothetical protein